MRRRNVFLGATAAIGAYAVASRWATRFLARPVTVGETVITGLHDDTRIDAAGRVSSIQSADVVTPTAALDAIWTPLHLERLARTYWRFLSRCTLGLIRVDYTGAGRYVVLVSRPFVLLAFHEPEYELDGDRGIVRWRIERGVLVAPPGLEGDGFLEIDVRRAPGPASGPGRPARRGRGGQLLPPYRLEPDALALPGHAVTDPCARDVRLPALVGEARPGRVTCRPVRRPAAVVVGGRRSSRRGRCTGLRPACGFPAPRRRRPPRSIAGRANARSARRPGLASLAVGAGRPCGAGVRRAGPGDPREPQDAVRSARTARPAPPRGQHPARPAPRATSRYP